VKPRAAAIQLFFGADAKNVVTACSTSLLPQSGQAISPSSYCNVSVFEKAFWQEWQKYSYCGMVYLLLMKIYGGIVRPKTGAHAGSCGSVGAKMRCALVLLKCLLSEAVELYRGDRAFEVWSGKAPSAMGAAPAGYGFIFGPSTRGSEEANAEPQTSACQAY